MSDAPSDFADLLDMNAEDAVRPPPRPGGTYVATLKSATDTISKEKRTPGLEMTFSDLDPQSDVNDDAYQEYIASPMVKPEEDTMSDSFWKTPKSVFRIRELCECCGVEAKGKTLAQMLGEAMGERLLITVQQNVGKGGTYANITGYAKIEE
jgi:hypothetical protein